MNERPSFTNLNQANTEINNIQNNITNGMNNVLNGDFSKATEQLNNINTQYNNLVNDLKNNNLYDNLQEKILKTNQMLDDFKNKTEQGLNAQKKSVSDMAESLPQILTVFRQIQETVDNISGKLNDANNTSISKFKNEVDNIKQLFDSLLETPLLDETKVQQSAKKISETYSDSLKSAFSMADIGKDLILESVKNNQNEIANEIKKILLDTSMTISNMSTNVTTNIGSSSDSIGSMDAITFNRLITDILANKLEESNKNIPEKIKIIFKGGNKIEFDNQISIIDNNNKYLTEFKSKLYKYMIGEDTNDFINLKYPYIYKGRNKEDIVEFKQDNLYNHLYYGKNGERFSKFKVKIEKTIDTDKYYIFIFKPNSSFGEFLYKKTYYEPIKYQNEWFEKGLCYIKCDSKQVGENICKYLRSDFCRLINRLRMYFHMYLRFDFVPWLDFSKSYTDEELFNMIGMEYNKEEIDNILKDNI